MSLKTIGLGRLTLDGRHISGFSYELDDARVGTGLQNAGIAAKLYAGKSEGRVIEIARQLARMRTDAYVLATNSETLGPSCQLAKALKILRPSVQVFFWEAKHAPDEQAHADAADIGTVLCADSVGALIDELTRHAGIACALPGGEPASSPYTSGLLTATDVARLGLTVAQNRELIAQELAWIAKQDLPGETIIRVDAHNASSDDLTHFFALYAISGARFPLLVSARVSSCDGALFGALDSASAISFELNGNLEELPPGASAWSGRISAAPNQGQRLARAALYGKNGSAALHTGRYFDAKQTPSLYHLEMSHSMPPETRKQVYSWAADAMDIRSAAVIRIDQTALAQNLSNFQSPRSLETNGWPKHVYAISLDAETLEGNILFDGLESTQQPIRYVALHTYNESELRENVVTVITTSEAPDVEALQGILSNFHDTGLARVNHPRYPLQFANGCRWVGAGNCRLPLLRRIQVDSALNLSSCRDAGNIGNVGDAYDHLVVRVKQIQQLSQVTRGCATCEIREECSQCSQLPESWGGQYCGIRKSNPQSALYFELYSLMYLVSPYLGTGTAMGFDMAVSYMDLPNLYYSGNVGEAPRGRRPVLARVDNQIFVWHRGTRKLARLSEPLALMFEGWWLGAAQVDIAACLGERFSVDVQTAETSLNEGLNKLKLQGMINEF